jgi:hypothetical protein
VHRRGHTCGALRTLITIFKVAADSERALSEIVATLSDLGQCLELFEIYRDSIDLQPASLASMFDILVELILCSVAAIRHLRKSDIGVATTVISWSSIRQRFSGILKEISNKVEHLRQLVTAEHNRQLKDHSKLIEQLTRMNMASTHGPGELNGLVLPCHTIPFPKNDGFYGRAVIIGQLSQAFAKPDGVSVSLVAIWGLGGIGKSQIALEFAYRQLADDVEIVLWIASEKDSTMASSFSRAANQLRVPGLFPTNTADQNRFLVIQYLQTTCESPPSSWVLKIAS